MRSRSTMVSMRTKTKSTVSYYRYSKRNSMMKTANSTMTTNLMMTKTSWKTMSYSSSSDSSIHRSMNCC
jgi:hypothetical protein